MSRSRRGRRGNGEELYDGEDPDEGDDIVVVDDDGNPIIDDVIVADDPIIDDPVDEDDPHIALAKNYEELKKSNAAIEQERDKYRTQLEQTQSNETETTRLAIKQGRSAVEGKIAAAKSAIKAAGESQDFEALAEAQTELSNAQFDLRELGSIERQFETEAAAPKQKSQGQAPQSHDARVDAFVKQLPDHAKKFVTKHREKLFPENDPKPFQRATAAYNYARDVKGLEEGTDEFYNYVEKEIGVSETPKRKQPPQRRPASAPVGRGSPAGQAQVHLSDAEMKTAKKLGMTPKRYALHKRTAQEGAKDPHYSGPRYSRDDPSIVGSNS